MKPNDAPFNPAVLAPHAMKEHQSTHPSPGGSRHFLYPGQVFVSVEPVTITTILGSCAAVCLWDRRKKVGGMNHYLLPDGTADNPNRLRYGNVANPALLNELLALGCDIKDLEAKIFGGASAYAADPLTALGVKNVDVAEQFLLNAGIKITAKDVSGKHGRKLLFNTRDGLTEVMNYQQVK